MPRRPTPEEGWPTFGLLAALVWATLRAVEAAGWGERVGVAPPLALLGAGVGLLAAKSRLRTLWALPLGLAVGFEAVIMSHAAMSPGQTWAERLGLVSTTFWGWLASARSQGAAHDPLVFGLLVGGLAYVLGLASSWLVFRLQSGWWALVLNASAGVVHLSYATVDSLPPFLLSIFLGVLMIASLELHLRRATWQAIGLPVQTGSTLWTLTAAAGLAALALIIGAQLPAGDINAELAGRYQALTEPWKDFQRSVDRLVGGGRGQARPGSGLSFSQSLSPREDFDLGTQPVLKVVSPQRRYWRTTTYDRYDGRSIAASGTADRRYEAGRELPADPDGGRARLAIEQRVTILSPSATALFAADAPRMVSVPVLIDSREVDWDVAGLRLPTPLQRGQSYTVTSLVPQAGRRELAEAPVVYPSWTERFLELPVGLPTRVGELTNQLTLGTSTPLDRALAIEAHLRSFTYSTHTTVPPPDWDWVDFLLFDSRQGYCDYFATAMTVMLRTQGIPARVASGFAPGVFDAREGAWLVRESEAHSWTEAYFPGYGWLTFEPSALRPTPERFESTRAETSQAGGGAAGGGPGDLEQELDGALGRSAGLPRSPVAPTPVGNALSGIALLALLLGLGLAVLALLWDRGLGGEPAARRRYAHLRRWLAWGSRDVGASRTPYEVERDLSSHLPAHTQAIHTLVQRHVEATYGRTVHASGEAEAEAAWRTLRRPLAEAMLRLRLSRPGRTRNEP